MKKLSKVVYILTGVIGVSVLANLSGVIDSFICLSIILVALLGNIICLTVFKTNHERYLNEQKAHINLFNTINSLHNEGQLSDIDYNKALIYIDKKDYDGLSTILTKSGE